MNIEFNEKDVEKIKEINLLKKVYRKSSVEDRKESSAEHSWSCLLIADLFLNHLQQPIDKLKVYELLIYHDVLEIETGDIPLTPENISKKNVESKDIKNVKDRLPIRLSNQFERLFNEFEEQKTIESKFAKLIDSIDPVFTAITYPIDWAGWDLDFFIKEKAKYFENFPDLFPIFNQIISIILKNNFLDKEMRYITKDDSLKRIPKNILKDFDDSLFKFTEPFMEKDYPLKKNSLFMAKRQNKKAIYIIKNKTNDLYNGILWNDPDVEMISNMDYMYCLQSWDWWIDYSFDPQVYRKEYLNHVKGVYGYSVIFTDNNLEKEDYFKKVINQEGFNIVEIKRLYEKNPLELYLFYDYWRVFLPLKLAREIKRIFNNIKKDGSKEAYFVLRGGYFIAEFLKDEKISKNFIIPGEENLNFIGKTIIDDCIVKCRNLKKMGLNDQDYFKLHCLDCVIPKEAYKNKFINAEIDLPENLFSCFSCRLFEKNPFLIGVDVIDGKTIYYQSLVRKKFIEQINTLIENSSLEEDTIKMSIYISSYLAGGCLNKKFEKLEVLKNGI